MWDYLQNVMERKIAEEEVVVERSAAQSITHELIIIETE